MSTKPLFLLRKAKKSSGEPDVVLWASDDFESTCATLDYLIVKSGKKLSNYFKAVATNFPVVNDLPPEGEIDFTWSERYQLSKDSMTWELKPGAAPDDVHHQEDAPETEEPTGGQEENAQADAHEDCQDCEVSVATLRFTQRLLHIFTYAAGDRKYLHHATREQRKHITALEMDQENSYVQNLLLAIRSMAEPTTLDNAALLRLTDAIKAVFSITKKHQPYEFKNFISAWLDTEHIDRGLLTKEWRKGNRVSRITRTASGANAGGGNKTDRNPNLVHTFDTLDVEIAAATLPMDFNIYEIPGSVYRRAKEVVRKKESPFKEWSAALRAIPGILDYSRAAIFALIRSAHPEFYHYPGRLQGYINAYLTETDHENPTEETLAAARHTPEKDILEEVNRELAAKRETEEEKNNVEKSQPSDAMADEQATAETMEPDTTEHRQDTQSLDSQKQVDPVNQVKVTADEVNKIMQAANTSQPDANQLLAVSRGEFVDGISDPNDPKWVKGIQTRDSVYQNQPETEKISPDAKQPEPVVQQEPEIVCNACGQTGGDNCPDCGAVMGDATYQETFGEENQVEAKEKDPEEMEGAEHPHNENAGSDPHRDCSDETGEVADPVIVEDIEPGIYYGISNENYHAGPGVSKSQLDDIADTPALYLWRKNAPVDTTKTKTLDLGTAFHCRVLEPEEFSNRFIVAPEFNLRTNAGKEEEKAFLMECASTGKTVITAEEGRKIELMYQSVMALPLGQWLVESAGHAESSIYWEDPETGILCRCRPDKIIPEFHWIMDVKTTADIQRFKTAYYDYRYHVQDAFYSDGYEAQFGVLPTFVFLVASTTVECGRYPVEIFMMGEEAKLAGQQEYHRNLRTLADCLNTDEWPAIKTLSLPRWAKEYAND
ncbi:exodeoxyribonuclease VIII [Salmonella enterica subsp. enterica]|nr:exodeoxyribonuclease VIII [Salmonella enterica subsp. enterica]EBM6883426.1 exodeoxyribonuclease VIII [Salmonella enterica]HEE9260810.1 exodeoxyribonuclease VIII [Salmonella enterica subsp. enterica serovar Typhimurium var. monophasic 4,[5],12:i:-]EBG5070964.1 exodeoxyribonuclease VIII [Salmonella enterica subsp. enterica]ECC9971122.1 exodeoxyribonuclease VIII [Salmonella enterica subsp. enterica]